MLSPVSLEAAAATDIGTMKCEVAVVNSVKLIRVHMPAKRAGELGVLDPRGVYWLLSFPDKLLSVRSTIPAKTVLSAKVLELPIAKTMGYTWIGTSIGPKPVFSWHGEYTIHVGAALQSDAARLTGWCKVRY